MLGLLAWGRRHCYKSRWHIQPEHQLPFQNQHRKIKLPAFSNVYLPAFIPVRHFILHISVNDNYVTCGCAIPIGKYCKITSHNSTATCLSGPRVGQHKPVVFLTGGGMKQYIMLVKILRLSRNCLKSTWLEFYDQTNFVSIQITYL